MSFLRLLAPVHGASTRRQCKSDLTLTLRVPAYGTVFMIPPDDPLWPHALNPNIPRDDQLLRGELDIHVHGDAPRHCKSIRVGFRSTARLLMGPARGWEEDVIFERKSEVMGGNSDGLVLEPGIQRFDFSIILPHSLAPHDWHLNGKVTHHLFAEVEGVQEATFPMYFGISRKRDSQSSFSSFRGSQSPDSPSPLPSPPLSRSASPPNNLLSPVLSSASFLSTTRQESGAVRTPSYSQSQAAYSKANVENDWIKGRRAAKRDLAVMYNPHPSGGASDLDERQSGFAEGIGVYDLKMFSDVFSIGGPIHARLTLPDLSPKTTIFNWRLLLSQTHSIQSPRDDPSKVKPITTRQLFTLMEHGKHPPKGLLCPGPDCPAMWRGTEAGGSSNGSLKIEGDGMMPKDDKGRPTTLPGVITPITVTHTLIYEVYFSVWGEDANGKPTPGPGRLRFLSVERPIMVPSCCLIPRVLDLPKYTFICHARPCSTCGLRRDEQLCLSCPPTVLPHPRHDLDPKIVGDTGGICPECSKSVLPDDDGVDTWGLCACGMDVKHLEERMKKFVLEGVELEPSGEITERHRRNKEASERRTGDSSGT